MPDYSSNYVIHFPDGWEDDTCSETPPAEFIIDDLSSFKDTLSWENGLYWIINWYGLSTKSIPTYPYFEKWLPTIPTAKKWHPTNTTHCFRRLGFRKMSSKRFCPTVQKGRTALFRRDSLLAIRKQISVFGKVTWLHLRTYSAVLAVEWCPVQVQTYTN